MRIEASWDEVKDDYADVVKESAEIGVPGFRKGKAPLSVVEQRYAQDIMEEVKNRCARRLWREALDENDLGTVGIAEISGMELVKGEGFTCRVEFGVVPEFELPSCADINLSRDADEGALRDEISRYLLENTQFDLPAVFIDEEIASDGISEDDPTYQDRRAAAEARVKLMIILKRIAREDGIEVDERDIDERIQTMAEAHGTTPKRLKNDLSTTGGLVRLRNLLLAEQVLDYIMERAT